MEKLELEKAYRLETEKLIKEALDKVQSKAENDEKQRLITAIVDELGINEHENEGSAVINAIQSLKQEVCEYKEQIERIELGAAIKENALVGEVESRNTEQIKNAVNAAKVLFRFLFMLIRLIDTVSFISNFEPAIFIEFFVNCFIYLSAVLKIILLTCQKCLFFGRLPG